MNPFQFQILVFLASNEAGAPVQIGTMSMRLAAIDVLIRAGLVQKMPCKLETHGRATQYALTTKGLKFLEVIFEIPLPGEEMFNHFESLTGYMKFAREKEKEIQAALKAPPQPQLPS